MGFKDYTKYEYVVGDTPILHNFHRKYRFENGFGASVIRGKATYGGELGLYELAPIKWEDFYTGNGADEFRDVFDMDGAVKGWLSEDEVCEMLKTIKNYNEEAKCINENTKQTKTD